MTEALAMDLMGWGLCSAAIVLSAYAAAVLIWGRGGRR